MKKAERLSAQALSELQSIVRNRKSNVVNVRRAQAIQ
jgi:hypothetical protein